jgi:hypothetical protein
MSARETPSEWCKSGFSQNGGCVGWRSANEYAYIRNSNFRTKVPSSIHTHSESLAFIHGVKAAEADPDSGRSGGRVSTTPSGPSAQNWRGLWPTDVRSPRNGTRS